MFIGDVAKLRRVEVSVMLTYRSFLFMTSPVGSCFGALKGTLKLVWAIVLILLTVGIISLAQPGTMLRVGAGLANIGITAVNQFTITFFEINAWWWNTLTRLSLRITPNPNATLTSKDTGKTFKPKVRIYR